MGPRIAWLLNLDAELELRSPKAYRPHPSMAARIAALVPRLASLIASDDLVIGPDTRHLAADIALAFCPTPSARRRLTALGFAEPAVSAGLVAYLARRAFHASLGQVLPGARYVESMPELAAALDQPAALGWLVKRDFSFAGRERLHVEHGLDQLGVRGFAQRSFARGEGLQVEPFCRRLLDASQHGYVMATGEILRGAPQLQACDARGTWLASEPAAEALWPEERTALERALLAAGEALAARGYRGPFGVDAFRYMDGNGPHFCARCEVNARFSMAYPRALLLQAIERGERP